MVSTNKIKYRRTQIFIYPKFQMTLILINFFISFSAFGVAVFEIYRVFSQFKDLGKSANLSPDNTFFKLIDAQLSHLYSSMILAFIVSTLTSFIITAILSHRLAGPIYRLAFYFKRIAITGKIESDLFFRRGDFYSDLPKIINDALKRISSK